MRAAWRRKKARGYKQFNVIGLEEQKTRERARKCGEKYYFFPRSCKRGHMYKRFVKSAACLKCALESSNRRWKLRRDTTEPEIMLFYSAKQRAREQNIAFSITRKDIRNVWPKDGQCPVLGIVLQRHTKVQDNSPSLDRIDPNGGYVPDNIAVVSHLANKIKYTVTDPEFFERLADWVSKPTTPTGEHICAQPRSRCSCYRMWDSAKRSAAQNSIPFNLTPDDILNIWPENDCCPISYVSFGRNTSKGPCPTSPTLDKIKPELGYVKGNVAIISYLANRTKNNVTSPKVFREVAAWLRQQASMRLTYA